MKTRCELEKKLKKLPDHLECERNSYGESIRYDLRITKLTTNLTDCWAINYIDSFTENVLLSVEHTSIQAAIDTMLSQIKKL